MNLEKPYREWTSDGALLLNLVSDDRFVAQVGRGPRGLHQNCVYEELIAILPSHWHRHNPIVNAVMRDKLRVRMCESAASSTPPPLKSAPNPRKALAVMHRKPDSLIPGYNPSDFDFAQNYWGTSTRAIYAKTLAIRMFEESIEESPCRICPLNTYSPKSL